VIARCWQSSWLPRGKVDGSTPTFSALHRDITREGSQLDAARKKARIGMELSGLSIGLAARFVRLDPFTGMLPGTGTVDLDRRRWASSYRNSAGKTIFLTVWSRVGRRQRISPIGRFSRTPPGGRPEDETTPNSAKGWQIAQLRGCGNLGIEFRANRRAFVETDMRAFANPTRLENIRLAAVDLGRRLSSFCPVCSAPGFVLVTGAGTALRDCGTPTNEVKADIHRCVRCEHQMLVEREREYASARYCDYCNP